jgi:hypothetical protein
MPINNSENDSVLFAGSLPAVRGAFVIADSIPTYYDDVNPPSAESEKPPQKIDESSNPWADLISNLIAAAATFGLFKLSSYFGEYETRARALKKSKRFARQVKKIIGETKNVNPPDLLKNTNVNDLIDEINQRTTPQDVKICNQKYKLIEPLLNEVSRNISWLRTLLRGSDPYFVIDVKALTSDTENSIRNLRKICSEFESGACDNTKNFHFNDEARNKCSNATALLEKHKMLLGAVSIDEVDNSSNSLVLTPAQEAYLKENLPSFIEDFEKVYEEARKKVETLEKTSSDDPSGNNWANFLPGLAVGAGDILRQIGSGATQGAGAAWKMFSDPLF